MTSLQELDSSGAMPKFTCPEGIDDVLIRTAVVDTAPVSDADISVTDSEIDEPDDFRSSLSERNRRGKSFIDSKIDTWRVRPEDDEKNQLILFPTA